MTMDLKLKDKVIIVTGGSKGVGRGICEVLASEKATPVIVGRNKENVLDTVRFIKDHGGSAFYAIAELMDNEQCKKAVERIKKAYGKVDGLVNNAGINDSIGLEKGDYLKFRQSIERNLVHYYVMAQLVLPELKRTQGAIVNIGSKTSLTGQGGTSGYAAANGGRNSLTREWAVELLKYKIRVNAVIVAECLTPLYKRWLDSFPNPNKKLEEIRRNIPLGNRMTTAKEIGNTVAFLLSEKSSHTTGQFVFVDGGYTHLDRAL